MKKPDDSLFNEIGELLIKAMDNAISKEEFDRLAVLLKENPAAREYYYDTLATFAGMDEIETPSINEGSMDLLTWQAMADIEKTAPTVIVEKARQIQNITLPSEQVVRKVNKVSLMVAVSAMAALLLMIIFVTYLPSFGREEVATLIDSVNAQWAEDELSITPDTRFAARQGTLTLTKGLVKLQFDTNAKVVIEAPAKFEIATGEQIHLLSGKIYASVPPEAVGFTIKTFNSKVVDLGTEFGVQVDHNGNTELHVLKGKTSLISGNLNKTSVMLTEGAAKRVSGFEANITDIRCDESRFAREINSENRLIWRGQSIQLADVVGNGNGFGTGRNIGLSAMTGQIEKIIPLDRDCSNEYKTVTHNPFIDGVFVPNGQTKQIVSSKGHIFEECPETCGNFYLEIVNSHIDPWMSNPQAESGDPSCLLLHANAGITFDLDAIRSEMPNLKIKQFQSYLCISKLSPGIPNCDFWILVDGKVRYSKKNVTERDFTDAAIIELHDNDRFLTLVTTDGGDPENRILPDGVIMKSINSDWCVFDKPVLVLE